MTLQRFTMVFLVMPMIALAQVPSVRIASSFGNPACDGNVLLKQFVKIKRGLDDLEAKNGPQDQIERYKLALSVLTPGLKDSANVFGMVVVATFDSTPTIVVPTYEIEGLSYPYATVIGNGNQFKFEFTQLGICAFADPGTNVVGDSEIRKAVSSMVH